jgi:hypothetical protein
MFVPVMRVVQRALAHLPAAPSPSLAPACRAPQGAPEIQSLCLGHAAFASCAAFIGGPDAPRLLSGAGDGTVRQAPRAARSDSGPLPWRLRRLSSACGRPGSAAPAACPAPSGRPCVCVVRWS